MRWTAAAWWVSFVSIGALDLVGCATGSTGRRAREDGGADLDAAELDAAALDAAEAGSVDAATETDAQEDDAAVPGDAGPLHCTPATASEVCGARPCVDGFCCDASCDGACRSCAVPGAEGLCTLQADGTDPDDECATQPGSSCGTTGVCDGAGACALHPTSVTCDDGMACTTGDACDGSGTCRGAAPTACAPGAGNECCLGGCGASGCRTDPGTCADICGASQLTVMRTCQGCGPAGAAGSCLGGAVHPCDATNHALCEQVVCGGTSYVCTQVGGLWSWRTTTACDDGDACTYADLCVAGVCGGSRITCTSTPCTIASCNGTASCTTTPRTGQSCDDGNACTYGETCTSAGVCGTGTSITCTSSACLTRTCNGTSSCTQTPRTGLSCDDGNACTFGESCDGAGSCAGGSAVSCPASTMCTTYACNGTSSCTPTQRTGMSCDDGNAATMADACRADGTCLGYTCPPALTTVFSDDFASPSSASWTSGTDAVVNGSRWHAFTSANHGVRITGGRLEITNARSSSPDHGQGHALVPALTTFAAPYQTVLDANAGDSVVWSFNLHRDDPESTDGGFSCSSTSSQNDVTVGVAFVLGATSASGLMASTSTCGASASASGYAVVIGGSSGRVRLVRFENGLRNGALTTLVQSGAQTVDAYFSVRVTYDTTLHRWTLEARSDGASSFANPASGTYSFSGSATDSVHTGESLAYTGPYFQTGCTGLCSSTYTARFDNVSVGLRCAP